MSSRLIVSFTLLLITIRGILANDKVEAKVTSMAMSEKMVEFSERATHSLSQIMLADVGLKVEFGIDVSFAF